MGKIGIITMYTNSKNYGGILQAFALQKIITKLGFETEQISFEKEQITSNRKKRITFVKLLKYPFRLARTYRKKYIDKKKCIDKELRNKKFKEFENTISHSEKVFHSGNIHECNAIYDIFVTGSDQVWNMNWYSSHYFLDFVSSEKYRFSYAASMPNINLSLEQEDIVKKHLKNFNSVSVREKKTADYLSKLLNREVQWTLDPTLLLDKDDWNEICSERIINEEYIFCYFLGTDKFMRNEAKRFARKKKVKIVMLPYLCGVNFVDSKFGDIRLYDVSPNDFISLIKYASYVITDSFHACVFSNIYDVKYFVFDRIGGGEMNERIFSLLDLFDAKERFCVNEKKCLLKKYDLPLSNNKSEFYYQKEKSLKFLLDNLKAAQNNYNKHEDSK